MVSRPSLGRVWPQSAPLLVALHFDIDNVLDTQYLEMDLLTKLLVSEGIADNHINFNVETLCYSLNIEYSSQH